MLGISDLGFRCNLSQNGVQVVCYGVKTIKTCLKGPICDRVSQGASFVLTSASFEVSVITGLSSFEKGWCLQDESFWLIFTSLEASIIPNYHSRRRHRSFGGLEIVFLMCKEESTTTETYRTYYVCIHKRTWGTYMSVFVVVLSERRNRVFTWGSFYTPPPTRSSSWIWCVWTQNPF